MTRRHLFGSRLHSQIVYPLVAAAFVIGLVASSSAVYVLGTLTMRWVGALASDSTAELAHRSTDRASEMQRIARYVAVTDPLLRDASPRYAHRIERGVIANSTAFDAVMMVVDSQGAVVAARGVPGVVAGDRLPALAGATPTSQARLMPVGDSYVLGVVYPLGRSGKNRYMLVVADVVDRSFLRRLAVGGETTFVLLSSDGRMMASLPAQTLDPGRSSELDTWLAGRPPALSSAIEDARGSSSRGFFEHDGTSYEVRVHPLDVEPRGTYAVGLVSQGIAERAGRQTVNLIAGLSLLGVIALTALGSWVTKRVTGPVVELSESARRVAEGDYDTKVRVGGAAELASLAEAFNQMTDSLHERSETLNKKMLELATLYEMSRSLSTTLDLDELLGSVLDSALAIFDLDLGYVSLIDAETGELRIRAACAGARSDACSLRSSMPEWVVREGRPLIFNPDGNGRGSAVDGVTGAKAALCVPLVSAEGSIGAIAIGSSDPEHRFGSDDVRLLSTIANHVTMAVGNIELFTTLQEAYLATVRSLAAAVDAKDTYTRGHSDRVAKYAVLAGERMGLSHDQRTALEVAAYLHDIGKIGVKEEILLKPGALDPAEVAQMRHHPLIGANILKPVAFPWQITPIVRHHHESWDGSGYPAGLQGEEIPLLARILSVADSFEAMTADRPYRRGRTTQEAAAELRRCAGTQFDPRVVDAFLELLESREGEGAGLAHDGGEEVLPEESRAIFSALVDGMFASFKRLGGRRLSANVQEEFDRVLAERNKPFRMRDGQLVFLTEHPSPEIDEIIQMRASIRLLEALLARACGSTLVEHFYTDALAGLSSRMHALAVRLGFHESSEALPL